MMKEYKQTVSSCFSCPMRRTLKDNAISIDWCLMEGKEIKSIHTKDFPEWCLLPDKEIGE